MAGLDTSVHDIAKRIDALALSADKQAELSRLPVDLRDRVEARLQFIYHKRQQEFEINKEAAKIAMLKTLGQRRYAVSQLKTNMRAAVEKFLTENFSNIKQQQRGKDA